MRDTFVRNHSLSPRVLGIYENSSIVDKGSSKIDVPKANITVIWTRVFEWYVDRCGSQSSHINTQQNIVDLYHHL